MKKFGIKEVVATGIGTALFIVFDRSADSAGNYPEYIHAATCSSAGISCSSV